MTDKEKIRAEVDRLLNKEWKWQSSIEGKYRCETYRELLEYIDSLTEEPISEDLEEEIDKELDENWYGEYINCEKFRKSAEHFFELGLKAQKGK